MVGFSGNPFLSLNPAPFIWTRRTGYRMNLDEFVRGQGTAMEQSSSLWEANLRIGPTVAVSPAGAMAFWVPQVGSGVSIGRLCTIKSPARKERRGQLVRL